MRWRNRLLLLLAVNFAFFTTTLLLQWRWRLPDDAGEFGSTNDGSWAAAVRHGSRLWAIAKQARKDYSVWSAVAAEAAGAANVGVRTDSEAVQHLRGAFQQRANLSAIQQAQHANLQQIRQDGSTAQRGGEEDGQGSRSETWSSGSGSAASLLDDELADTIPGDGSGFTMQDPAIIVFAYNRPLYLQQTLDSLSTLEGLGRFALYISQDGGDNAVRSVIRKATRTLRSRARHLAHWQRPRKPQLGDNQPHGWRSQHYKWGLDRVFEKRGHSHLIVLEDDMESSPDFLLYFEAMAQLLEVDPTLWCISSWNDNSRAAGFRWDAKRMMRTSYLSGLGGWMLRRQLWEEIGTSWPQQQWDMWMRLPTTSRGRDCLAPEINRNRYFSSSIETGSFRKHLQNMTWHTDTVRDWGDLSYLVNRNYEAGLRQLMTTRAQLVPASRLDPRCPNFLEVPPGHVYLVPYRLEEYAHIAAALRIWPYPRAHYQNVALLPYRGSFFLLADARACPLLPESQRILPSAGLLAVAAQRGQSCSSACSARGQECSADDFWFLNSCKALRQHFACELGCATEMGPDMPSYVEDETLSTFHQCLVTQRAPSCLAHHQGTSQLCPCITRGSGFAAETDTSLTGNKVGIIKPKGDQLQMGLVAA